MSETKTIADSKRVFHEAFPHVIPPIYRRLADELLVELHLLSRNKNFQPDPLFEVGVYQVFNSFTNGYRPEKHLTNLFNALCECNGFDPIAIQKDSQKLIEIAKEYEAGKIEDWFKNKGIDAPERIKSLIDSLYRKDIYYTRLQAIGLFSLLTYAKPKSEESINERREMTQNILGNIGFSQKRVERDLNLYKSNLERLTQAIELLKETIEADKKRRSAK